MKNHLSISASVPPYIQSDKIVQSTQGIPPVQMKKKVAIIQRALPQYRKDFFNQLKRKLEENGVELTLIYGKFKSKDALKKDEVDLDWGTYLPNKVFHLRNTELVWQPCLPYLADKDLVIVEQANRNLINYYLMLRRLLRKQFLESSNDSKSVNSKVTKNKSVPKLAYWGHGRNLQATETDARNRFKKFFLNQCDWWFAYTEKVKEELISSSFPADQVTCVQNAIDTKSLTQKYESITQEESYELKKNLGIASHNVGIYCGGIYKEKRIQFLIDACDKVRSSVPDFHLIVIGSGPDAHIFAEAIQSRPWIHFIGPKFGLDRVIYFKIASLFLMPGLVGLAILDSFAMRTPMVTTAFPFHSPEIEYLKNGSNGLMTSNTLESYVAAVIAFLQNEEQRKQLIEGCIWSSSKYTVEQMVNNFAGGILKALNVV